MVPGIAGWLGRQCGADDKDLLGRSWANAQGVTLNADAAHAHCLLAQSSGENLVEGELTVTVVGNLDWLSVEFADVQSKRGAAASLCEAYRRLGNRLLDVIGGRFAIAVWDESARSGLVAVDRFGLVPVYWSQATGGGVQIGPTALAVNTLNACPPALRAQGVFNYLFFHMVPGPETIFEGVHKLMAAHVLELDDKGPTVRRYWRPDFREHGDRSLSDASQEMLGLLSSSVERLSRDADIGAFLSGGLDSSTVAGLLARQRPNPKTYSIGFDAQGYDEIGYARIASDRFGTEFNTYYVTPRDVVTALPEIAAAYDEPFGNSSALPAYFCAQLAARDGRTRLLAGDGGDELFAGNERYMKQRVFERYRHLPRWFRGFLLEPLLSRAPAGLPKVDKARSYVAQANIALPARLQTYNFLNRLGAEKVCATALIDAVDTDEPDRLQAAVFSAPAGATQLNRMLYLDWHHTLTDNDLRKVNRMCQLAGIEVEYPMLDDRLVEFSTRVSSSRKLYRGKLRGFYKHAVKGFLPEEIINKPKQGFGLPFGVWMANDAGLQALAADYLSSLRHRDIVRPGFLDELLELHKAHHAGYYGELIWVLVMLAMWLEAHRL